MPLAIARNASASDHLVHGWSLGTIADDIEIACAADEAVVMCPSFAVGETLGPGHHRWRNPDLARPAAAFFVLTSAVEVEFDLVTRFMLPVTREPVALRATGALMIRCSQPAVLVAQFVGLPLDDINGGLLRSVARSVERLAARLLIAQVLAAGNAAVVLGPDAEAQLIEQLVAYGPTAGAVFGIELARVLRVSVSLEGVAVPVPIPRAGTSPGAAVPAPASGPTMPMTRQRPGETRHGRASSDLSEISGVIEMPPRSKRDATTEPLGIPALKLPVGGLAEVATGRSPTLPSVAPPPPVAPAPPTLPAVPPPRRGKSESLSALVPPLPGPATEVMNAMAVTQESDGDAIDIGGPPAAVESPSAIGMGRIGDAVVGAEPAAVHAEIVDPDPRSGRDDVFARGERVLVAGADGRLVAATVRDRQAGYYQLEIGGTGETAWVPEHTVVSG